MNKNTSKSNNKRKLTLSVGVLAIIFVVCLVMNRTTWAFSSVYSQKNLTDKFLMDISKGNTEGAYLLTSSAYKKVVSYNSFYSQAKNIEYNKMSIANVNYVTSKAKDTIGGIITDQTLNDKLVFYINVSKIKGVYGIDSLIITSIG